MSKIVIASLPIGGLTATEAASRLTRAIRAQWPAIPSDQIIQLPLADGGEGTIDLLVTHSLGSFLEVEATSATGEEVVVPLGFAGEDGKLAIIEMGRVARSSAAGGTTYGVGELIRDALDEGAFSVLLGHDEPLACDAGLGAAAALGVKFFDTAGHELDLKDPSVALSKISRIDPSGRAFEILSSRFFVARSARTVASSPSTELQAEIERLREIVQRDGGVPVATGNLSASGVEFGLTAFCGAEVRDGMSLVIEATGIEAMLKSGECAAFVMLAENPASLDREAVRSLLNLALAEAKHVAVIFSKALSAPEKKKLFPRAAVLSLAEAKLFAQPLGADASLDTIRRDALLRLEKIVPELGLGITV